SRGTSSRRWALSMLQAGGRGAPMARSRRRSGLLTTLAGVRGRRHLPIFIAFVLVWACAAPVTSPEPSTTTGPTPTVAGTPSATEPATALPTETLTPSPELTCAQKTLVGMGEAERLGPPLLLGLPGTRA